MTTMRKRARKGVWTTFEWATVLAALLNASCATFDAESERLQQILALGPGAIVADVGAGHGEWALEMARRVGPSGRVFATEIDPARLREIRTAVAEEGVKNVVVIAGSEDDTGLPPRCCDAIFLRHVYHHITEPEPMSASLLRALRPHGLLAVIDFDPPTRLIPSPKGVPENRRGHGMPASILIEEMTRQGFIVAQRIDDWFRFDYCVVFRSERPVQ